MKSSQKAGASPHECHSVGWNHNDYNLVLLYSTFILNTAQVHAYKGIAHDKMSLQQEVIDFAQEYMQARTFRQIARKTKELFPKIVPFDHISVFFKNFQSNYMFTVTDTEERVDTNTALCIDTAFAKDLYFPDEEIIMFPGDMGVTGWVCNSMTHVVDNNFGQVMKERQVEAKPKKIEKPESAGGKSPLPDANKRSLNNTPAGQHPLQVITQFTHSGLQR